MKNITKIIKYGEEELAYLSKRDRKLMEYIRKLGFVERECFDGLFTGLCYSIIGQQISMKVADRLYGKLISEIGAVVPENIPSAEQLFGYGLSHSKADCIALCAEKFKSGELSYNTLAEMSDSEFTKTLTQIKGVGEWTAEMTLIFGLGRRDVLSLSDYGIRKGLSVLHGIDIKNKAAMLKFKELYSPYGTTASVYLWEIAKEGV